TNPARSNERVSAAANVIRWISKGVSSRASNPSVSLSGEKGPAAGRAITLQLLDFDGTVDRGHRAFLEVELATGSAFRPGSKSGNTRLSKAGFSKMPVSSILVLGVSNPHHHKGDRHGRPSYVLVLVHAIRPRSSRRTAQPPSLAGPEAATPGAAGSGYPSARWSSTSLRLGPGT